MRTIIEKTIDYLSIKLQLNVRYFVAGGAWLLIPTLVSYLLGMLRSVAFARLAEQSVYGQYNFVLSIVGLASILTLPGISAALVETVARGNWGALLDATRVRLRWGLLSTLVITGVAIYYLLVQAETELATSLVIAGSTLPLASALGMIQHYHSGRQRFDLVSQITTVLLVFKTVLVLLLLWLGQGLVWLVIANSGIELLLYGTYYAAVARVVRDAPRDPDLEAYGKSLTVANGVLTMAGQLDGAVLGFSAGFVDVAIYKIATVLPDSLKGLMKMLTTLSIPKIAEQPGRRVYSQQTRRRLLYLLIFNLLAVLAAIVVLPALIALLYGERYTESAHFAQALMLSLIFGWPSSFFAAALQARKQTRSLYRANAIYGALQVGTLVATVPIWGTWGIVLSRIVSRWGLALYQWHAVKKI